MRLRSLLALLSLPTLLVGGGGLGLHLHAEGAELLLRRLEVDLAAVHAGKAPHFDESRPRTLEPCAACLAAGRGRAVVSSAPKAVRGTAAAAPGPFSRPSILPRELERSALRGRAPPRFPARSA